MTASPIILAYSDERRDAPDWRRPILLGGAIYAVIQTAWLVALHLFSQRDVSAMLADGDSLLSFICWAAMFALCLAAMRGMISDGFFRIAVVLIWIGANANEVVYYAQRLLVSDPRRAFTFGWEQLMLIAYELRMNHWPLVMIAMPLRRSTLRVLLVAVVLFGVVIVTDDGATMMYMRTFAAGPVESHFWIWLGASILVLLCSVIAIAWPRLARPMMAFAAIALFAGPVSDACLQFPQVMRLSLRPTMIIARESAQLLEAAGTGFIVYFLAWRLFRARRDTLPAA